MRAYCEGAWTLSSPPRARIRMGTAYKDRRRSVLSIVFAFWRVRTRLTPCSSVAKENPPRRPRGGPTERKVPSRHEDEAGVRELSGSRVQSCMADEMSRVRRIEQISQQGGSIVNGAVAKATQGRWASSCHDQAPSLGQGRKAGKSGKPHWHRRSVQLVGYQVMTVGHGRSTRNTPRRPYAFEAEGREFEPFLPLHSPDQRRLVGFRTALSMSPRPSWALP